MNELHEFNKNIFKVHKLFIMMYKLHQYIYYQKSSYKIFLASSFNWANLAFFSSTFYFIKSNSPFSD